MKSNKQRRAEIKQARLARAERIEAQLHNAGHGDGASDGRQLRMAGMEPADRDLLARHNNTYGLLSGHYVDRPYRCRDCGSEEVWTAKQQKWWYEVRQGDIHSDAVRCLACRRARRATIAKAQSAPGANRIGDEVAWLRGVGAARPDAETERRVEAALASKWDGVRKVAIDVLARWRRPEDAERLRAWMQDERLPWYSGPRQAAAQALAPLLRHPDDDAWVLEAFASARYMPWPWGGFVHDMPVATLDAFLGRELDAGEPKRLENLCLMLVHARRVPSEPVWRRLREHPVPGIGQLARQVLAAAGRGSLQKPQ